MYWRMTLGLGHNLGELIALGEMINWMNGICSVYFFSHDLYVVQQTTQNGKFFS